MKNLYKIVLVLALTLCSGMNMMAQKGGSTKYKCMVQMTNYPGEGAYEKTLYVMGSDKKWYKDIKEWYKFHSKKPSNISAITGASLSGGERSVTVLELEDSKINSGYSLRFETAVENQEYKVKDIEFPLTTENVSGKNDGTGYIRYVRLSPN